MYQYISEIAVKGLFGRYNYNLQLGNRPTETEPRLSFLYGDNGTGKTTILNLVFHLLSCLPRRNHKTIVARLPFQEFSVLFSDQTKLSASRPLPALTGNFLLRLTSKNGSTVSQEIPFDPEENAVSQRVADPELDEFLERISLEVPDVFYLGDTRTLESDKISTPDTRIYRARGFPSFDEDDWYTTNEGLHEQRALALRESIQRTQRQLYVDLAQASTRGEVNARQIYADILASISSETGIEGDMDTEVSSLKKALLDLQNTSFRYSAFNLGSAIDASPYLSSLEKGDSRTLPTIVQVLRSFLDGQRARLGALEPLYTKMHNFVSITNEYFIDKGIVLDLSRGLTIRIPGGALEPEYLSSGEQHLLLLFLNVLSSTDRPRLFLIDEPELSLNIKWQRQLVDSLVQLTAGTQCQFLLATHSMELLARHRDFVVPLKS